MGVADGVGVRVAQLPFGRQTASRTGTQPSGQVPSLTGPQAGRGHWQQSSTPAVGVCVAVAGVMGAGVAVAVADAVGVAVGVGVRVRVAQLPVPRQTASYTGTHAGSQAPATTGPQAGRGHWQQSFGPGVLVGVSVAVRVAVVVGLAVAVGVAVAVGDTVGVAVVDGV